MFNLFIWSFHFYRGKFKEKTSNNNKCFIQLRLMPFAWMNEWKIAISYLLDMCWSWHLVRNLKKTCLEKNMPPPRFEPGSPRPRTKLFDELDRTALGPLMIGGWLNCSSEYWPPLSKRRQNSLKFLSQKCPLKFKYLLLPFDEF